MTVPTWLSAFIAILRTWIGIMAETQQKQQQQQHTGEVIRDNAGSRAEVQADEAALKADADSLGESNAQKLEALREGAE